MILSIIAIVIATGCSEQTFVGKSTSNDSQFILDYSIFNSTKTHEIKLGKGATINVGIENKAGRVDILISNSNGEKIYKGDNATSGKFSLDIPKEDTYKFSVTGINAKGNISFEVAD